MNRLLLTLLALLSGLFAPVASANAAVHGKGAAEVSAVQTAKVAARAAARIAVQVRGPVEPHNLSGMRDAAPFSSAAKAPRTILIGIDRARE